MEDYLLANPWLIAVLAVMVWTVVLSFVARMSGWSALAEHYEATDSYEGPQRRFQSVSMGRGKIFSSSYGGVVEFGADARGLHMATFVLFRPFHPPLVIPWSDLHIETRQVAAWTQTVVTAARAAGINMTVGGHLAEWMRLRRSEFWSPS